MSIFKRGRVWWFEFQFNGQRVQRSTKQGNRKAAVEIEAAHRTALAKGEVGLEQSQRHHPMISELLDKLEQFYLSESKISPQTRSTLSHVRQDFGGIRADRLTSETIDRYISQRQRAGKAAATINRSTELLRRAYKLAGVTPPGIRHLSEKGNERKGFFSDGEFRRVLSHLPDDLRDFALFGYLTGWRKNEISSLTWSDVEDNLIRLRSEHSKNGEPRSVVIADELISLIERRKQKRLSLGVLTSLVFHRSGEPIKEMRKSWKSACKKAGVTGRLFHDLRRTAVRNLVRSGVPQSVAMKISGHKTASMFRRYDIANEDDLRSAMQAVERYHAASADKVVTLGGSK